MSRLSNISRRRFLRGVAGGALTTVALPFFEASLGTTARAFAADGFPKRFGLFYWANGVLPQYWTPAETGANYTLSEQLQPVKRVRRADGKAWVKEADLEKLEHAQTGTMKLKGYAELPVRVHPY